MTFNRFQPVMTDPVYGRSAAPPLAPTSPVQVDPVPTRPTGPLGSITNPHIATALPSPTSFATTDAAMARSAPTLPAQAAQVAVDATGRPRATPGFRNFLRMRRNAGPGGLMSLSSFPGGNPWRQF